MCADVWYALLSLKKNSMYSYKIEEDLNCGIRVALKVFGGKWKCCILEAISRGIARPSDIGRYIPEASLRVIEMQLSELLFFGAVEKSSAEAYPRNSTYRLTPLGESILPVLSHIEAWGMAHAEFVKERQLELE
jgi:DNA-binding HxlR family transcriptional regulator